ncbi:pyocin S6 family toxin immunity protein [Pseudomonas sp. NFX15]|uniref:pyocin S6 family toxin immunity protein n=1 Tax=Pseudomonas sp. NFX15 TaxID=2816958 RepID=UPI003B8CF245
MHLNISGFFVDDREDDSLQFELDIPTNREQAILDVMKWKSLTDSPEGEFSLTPTQVQQIEFELQIVLPRHLALYIGVES